MRLNNRCQFMNRVSHMELGREGNIGKMHGLPPWKNRSSNS